MAKKKKKPRTPYTPPTQWDHGQQTAAQNHLKVIEDAGEVDPKTGKRVNPNGVTRARRQSVLEHCYARGLITARQFTAGQVLAGAWQQNFRSPSVGLVQDRVDRSPKPDENVTVQIDRLSKYHRLSKLVVTYRPLVLHVVCDDRFLSAMPGYTRGRSGVFMDRLRDGLDALADRMERRGR